LFVLQRYAVSNLVYSVITDRLHCVHCILSL
jgi:hypothetical protein